MKAKYEDTLIHQINSSAKYFEKLLDQIVKELNSGLSASEHIALLVIHDTKDCCQRDLARVLLKDRANTGKLAKALEERGLVEISATIKNNRAVKTLTITKKGEEIVKYTKNIFNSLKEQIEQEFSRKKLDEMIERIQEFTQLIAKTVKIKI